MTHLQQARIQAQNIEWKTTTHKHGKIETYITHENKKTKKTPCHLEFQINKNDLKMHNLGLYPKH
jgi:hypothetical protein